MAQVVPNARLVYVVRDPIARMQSMYMHQVSAGREHRWLEPRWRPDQRTGLARRLTTRRARADDSAIPPELRGRLAERLAPDQRRFEQLLGYQIPADWAWSTSVSA